MKVLIEEEVPVNTYHADGFLPLHRACWGDEKSHAETVRFLRQHGIPSDIKSRDAETCVKMAENLDVVNVMEEETGLGFNDLFDDDLTMTTNIMILELMMMMIMIMKRVIGKIHTCMMKMTMMTKMRTMI